MGLVAAVSADDGYSAPQTGYGPPADSYGAPEPSYTAPSTGYGATGTSYTATGGGGDLLDLDKLAELAPLFLAVFAAIILANILGPLIGALFTFKAGLVTPLLDPIGSFKGTIINIILGVFGLQLCDRATPPAAFPAAGRSEDSWNYNGNLDLLTEKFAQAIQNYSS